MLSFSLTVIVTMVNGLTIESTAREPTTLPTVTAIQANGATAHRMVEAPLAGQMETTTRACSVIIDVTVRAHLTEIIKIATPAVGARISRTAMAPRCGPAVIAIRANGDKIS